MKTVLVTGASGFLGTHTVAAAAAAGHRVKAMIRPATNADNLPWSKWPNVEIVRGDLRSKRGLVEAIEGSDVVLHLAAAKTGDIYDQLAGTVMATENLLWAMEEAGLNHIVSISSFSVYDYRRMRTWSVLDEESPLEHAPTERDAYCQTKLIQENQVKDFAAQRNWKWTILRPGVIFGQGNAWTARLGMQLGKKLIVRTGAWAQLPLTYVENCAEAIVAAGDAAAADGQIINVVDNETPTQRSYIHQIRQRMSPQPKVFPIAYSVMRLIAGAGALVNKLCFGGKAKTPSILAPASLQARCKPLRYSNEKIRAVLNWQPRYSVSEALDRTFGTIEFTAPKISKASSTNTNQPAPADTEQHNIESNELAEIAGT